MRSQSPSRQITKFLILSTLIASTLHLTSCGPKKSTVTSEQTTVTSVPQESPGQSAPSPSPQIIISEGESPDPEPVPPATEPTPSGEDKAESPKPEAKPPAKPQDSELQPGEVAIQPDRPLPEAKGVQFGDVDYVASEQTADLAVEQAIEQVMADGSGDRSFLKSMRYYYDRVDLNKDGDSEALVYLMGSYSCGSGGCTMLILEPTGQSYELVSKMTLVNPPVLIADQTSAGWKDLVVYVEGGGAEPHYARMQFDGKGYPSNPSMAPEVPSDSTLNGTAIISDSINPGAGIAMK